MNMNSRIVEDASDTFVQRLQGKWSPDDQAALEDRLARDPAYADAWQRAEAAWGSLDAIAETPEVIARRERSLMYVRQASALRWRTPWNARSPWRWPATAASLVMLLGATWIAWQWNSPDRYQTGIGEQRLVDLSDRSRMTLDARTEVAVQYSEDARLIELKEGQAQFTVAKDSARPFKVRVGDRTIVALGTAFTVEHVGGNVRVALLEGRVAVTAPGSSVELQPGQEWRVRRGGKPVVAAADMASATAWRIGKVIFREERLDEAVQRMNRYSRLQIEIADDALRARNISGVFEAGDSEGFVSVVQRYYPVVTDYVSPEIIRLR